MYAVRTQFIDTVYEKKYHAFIFTFTCNSQTQSVPETFLVFVHVTISASPLLLVSVTSKHISNMQVCRRQLEHQI